MPRFDPIRNSFIAGEISPLLLARDDLDQFRKAASRIRNFIVLPHGGVTRRPGTRFVSEVHDSTRKVRLAPFRFSVTNVYVVELGHYTARFYSNGGIVTSGGSPVVVSTPWSEDDLDQLQWAQEADVLYIVHPNYWPRKLTRTGPTSFSLSTVAFSNGRAPLGPYNTNKNVFISTNVAGTTYDRRFTFSAAHGLTSADLGRTFHVYRYRKTAGVKFRAATCTIRQIVSATIIEVDVDWEYEAGDASNISGADSYTWALGLFSATEGCNAVTFHEGRLVYGGFKRRPDYFVASVSDDFDNFELENVDPEIDDAFNADKAFGRRTVSREVNAIRWLASTGQALVIGTSGAEFLAQGNVDGIMTPADAVVKPATVRGSEPHIPVVLDGSVFFVQRGGRALRRLSYDFDNDQFSSVDVSVLAEHLFRPGVREIVYHQTPYSVIWAVRGDGKLVGVTFERDQQIIAAHLHDLGGDPNFKEAPQVESVAVVPGADGEDELWLAVRRRLSSGWVRYVEYLTPSFRVLVEASETRWERSGHLDDAFFVDCGVTYDQPIAVTNIFAGVPPDIVTAVPHGLSLGDPIRFRGVGGWSGEGVDRAPWGCAEVDQRLYRVHNVGSPTMFRLGDYDTMVAVDGSGFSTFQDPYGTARVYKEVTTLSGLSHLAGAEVEVWIDGGPAGRVTVDSSGAIVLPRSGSLIHVGFAYSSILETTPITGGNPRGSDRGSPAALGRVTLLLAASGGGKVGRGPVPSSYEDLEFRVVGDALDRPAPLFEGPKTISLTGSWDSPATIVVRVDDPSPLTVLGLVVNTVVGTDA